MKEIKSINIHSDIRKLLSFATSEEKVEYEYNMYILEPTRKLFGYMDDDKFVGCIGIELTGKNHGEIKHIAVDSQHRKKGIGSAMIRYIWNNFPFTIIVAETDNDAVQFYKNYGFNITSLGEKYPGVERLHCILTRQ